MNELTVFIISISISILIGFLIGFFTKGFTWLFISLGIILITSNLWTSIPWIGNDFKLWHSEYMGGLSKTGAFSILFHTLPAYIAFHVARRLKYKVEFTTILLAVLSVIALIVGILVIHLI